MMKNVIMVEPTQGVLGIRMLYSGKWIFLNWRLRRDGPRQWKPCHLTNIQPLIFGFHDGHHIGDGWTRGKNTNASCINIVLNIGQFKLLRYDVSVRQGQTIYNVLNIIYPVLCCFINDTFMFITFALWWDTVLPSACRISNIRNTFYIDSKISNRQMSKVMLNGD